MATTADALARRWFENLWNQNRVETIDEMLAPNSTVHGLPTPDNQPLVGPAAFKEYYWVFRKAFPICASTSCAL